MVLAPTVGMINILVELGIGFGSEYTRPINHQKNVIDTAFGICWIQLINLGVMFLVINFNMEGKGGKLI